MKSHFEQLAKENQVKYKAIFLGIIDSIWYDGPIASVEAWLHQEEVRIYISLYKHCFDEENGCAVFSPLAEELVKWKEEADRLYGEWKEKNKYQTYGTVIKYDTYRGLATIQLENNKRYEIHIAGIYGIKKVPEVGMKVSVDLENYTARIIE